jgi:hypothetical protein
LMRFNNGMRLCHLFMQYRRRSPETKAPDYEQRPLKGA